MKKFITILLALCFVLSPAIALADGVGIVTEFKGTAAGSDEKSILLAIRNVVNAFLTLVGVIAVIYVIIGGVRYITSQGDENAAALAKMTILYSLLGIAVIILSAVLVNLVISSIQRPSSRPSYNPTTQNYLA